MPAPGTPSPAPLGVCYRVRHDSEGRAALLDRAESVPLSACACGPAGDGVTRRWTEYAPWPGWGRDEVVFLDTELRGIGPHAPP